MTRHSAGPYSHARPYRRGTPAFFEIRISDFSRRGGVSCPSRRGIWVIIKTMEHPWHAKEIPQIFELLGAAEQGLTSVEAKERLAEYGPNKLPEPKVPGVFHTFVSQFQSPLIYVLLAASGIMVFVGEAADSMIILAVLVFNAVVGTIQEGKANNTLRALKQFIETSATVLRDGTPLVTRDAELVPGDVIVLQEGEKIPADAHVMFSSGLKIDEASLTGESLPALKGTALLDTPEPAVGDRHNMVFKGTHVVSGSGKAVVVTTGGATEIGKISASIAGIDTEIPLKANIRYLSRLIIAAVGAVSLVLFASAFFTGTPLVEMFATAVALAVSVIPEGLPIVMTLVLASGVWRMTKRNVLVKKLHAVEALGQARVIAVDKTGTLTKNEMTLTAVYADGKMFSIGGSGYDPKGEVARDGKMIEAVESPELILAGRIAVFCTNAEISFLSEQGVWKVSGDPTEAAMKVFAEKVGFHKDVVEAESPRVFELPFDYKKRYHATIHTVNGKGFLSVAGAPEELIHRAAHVWREGGLHRATPKDVEEFEAMFMRMSKEGLRVVAFGMNENYSKNSLETGEFPEIALVGLYGMRDALRPEARDAVLRAEDAGIRVVMITGDHQLTAENVAREAGIFAHEGDVVLTGGDIDAMSDEELSGKLGEVSVFARVNPMHKLRIIGAYQKRGEIIAMTGDGVNDAPSLAAADLGVAMGKIGTEVAKEAADLVLLDDNFGSIIDAVEEGRNIYKTIKKVILYLFSTSIGEVLTIGGAIFLGLPVPLLPSQIIWLNFVTDGFLDVSLAMEPKEEKLLRGDFERPKKYLLDRTMVVRAAIMGATITVGTLALFMGYLDEGLPKALTMSLTVLAVFQWFNAWNCRHDTKSLFQINPFSNKFLIGATVNVVSLQFFALNNGFLQEILHIIPITADDWFRIVPVAFSVIVVEEIRKGIVRLWNMRKAAAPQELK